jgi:hypothetical protein
MEKHYDNVGLENEPAGEDRQARRSGSWREIWDSKMLWTYVFSRGRRVFMDQNCVMNDPPNFQPLVKMRPEWQFTEADIRNFCRANHGGDSRRDGRIPAQSGQSDGAALQGLSHREKSVARPVHRRARVLGYHFDAAIERAAGAASGTDLMVWRSQIFNKKSGDPEITWH